MMSSWRNVCSKPSDEVLDHCSAMWAKMCSCGQLKPFPPTTTFLPPDEEQHVGDGNITPEKYLLWPHAQIPSNKGIQDEQTSLPTGEIFVSSFLVDSPDATLDDIFFKFSREDFILSSR